MPEPNRGVEKLPGRTHVPIRTCVVCGAKRGKHELVRLALDCHGFIRVDDRRRLDGRGAYVCTGCRPALRFDKRLRRAFRFEAKGLAGDTVTNSEDDSDLDSAKPADDIPWGFRRLRTPAEPHSAPGGEDDAAGRDVAICSARGKVSWGV